MNVRQLAMQAPRPERLGHRLLIGSLVLALIFCLLGPSMLAAESPEFHKEEVVYAVLQPDASPDQLIVINQFKLEEPAEVTDYGAYSQVQALDDRVQLNFDPDQGSVTFPAQAGYNYYRGDLQDRELPWIVKFSYLLDGQETPAQDLTGASGHFKFHLELAPNPHVDPAFREGFILQLSIQLDKSKYSDLESDASMQAEAGSKTMLNWVLLPREDQPALAEFSCQVQNFSLPSPNLAAVPLQIGEDSIPEDLVKLDDLLANSTLDQPLTKLTEGVDRLQSGSQDLTKASKQIAEALQQLDQGGENLTSDEHLSQLQEGLSQLQTGAADLNTGLQQYSAGVTKLAKNYPRMSDGLSRLSTGIKTLADKTPDLQAGLRGFASGLDQMIKGLAQNLPTGDMAKLGQGLNLEEALQTLDGVAANLKTFAPLLQMDFQPLQAQLGALAKLNLPSAADLQALQTLLQSQGSASAPDSASVQFQQSLNQLATYGKAIEDPGVQAQYQQTLQQLQAAASGMAQERQVLLENLSKLQTSLAALQALQGLDFSGLNQSLDQLIRLQADYGPQLAGMSEQIALQRQALSKLSASLNQSSLTDLMTLYQGLQDLQNGYADLQTGMEAYLDGIQTMAQQMPSLQAGAKEFGQGLNKLAKSGTDLEQGSQEFTQGFTEYGQGLDQYYAGIEELAQGLSQLSNQYQDFDAGVNQLAEGLDKFQTGLADLPEDINPQMQEVLKNLLPQYKPQSFVSPQNQVDTVQFVMILPAVAEAKDESHELVDEPDDRSFWEKFRDLFK